jgi:hypothetical protein
MRDPSGAQAGEFSVPLPLFQSNVVPVPSALAAYTANIEKLLGPPTKAIRPSGPQLASRTYAGTSPDSVSAVGVPELAVEEIVNRCPPCDITSAESSGDQSGDDSATEVPVTRRGEEDPSAGTTYTCSGTTVSIFVKAIIVPSFDHTVSNSCVWAPNAERFVVTSVTEFHTYSCQHGDAHEPLGVSRTNASLVPGGSQAGARSLVDVWISGVTVPDPGDMA